VAGSSSAFQQFGDRRRQRAMPLLVVKTERDQVLAETVHPAEQVIVRIIVGGV
jgi:hypothetical protein